MSEQRGVRDGGSGGSEDPDETGATESAGSEAELAKPDLSKSESSASASSEAQRPTGKRRTRGASSGSSTSGSTQGSSTGGKGVATATRVAGRTRADATPKSNPFARLVRFLREVVAELRKVIWPNKKQMVTYTVVVVVFVTFMVAFISGLDLAFIKGVTWLFG